MDSYDYDKEGRNVFEWRILALESLSESLERRANASEIEMARVVEKLNSIDDIKKAVARIEANGPRLMGAFIVTILAVLGTFILGHLTGIAH